MVKVKTARLIYPTILLLVWGSVHYSCTPRNEGKSPNILLINIDDLGWKDLGYTGSRYYESPYIDRLSRTGMIFSNGYAAASNCAPSRACLMTGKWTSRHDIYTVASSARGDSEHRKIIPIENTTLLSREHITVADLLKSTGYTTCLSGKWHLSESPEDYGFDLNIGGGLMGHPASYYPPYQNVMKDAQGEKYLTDLIMDETLQFLDTVREPFFLYYAPYAVHTPIQAVNDLLPKYKSKSGWEGQDNADYATMVENLDRNIGRLISLLEKKDILHNTFLIFTSDNGGHFGITKQRPLRAGKGSYYEGGIRVPFFFVWEANINPGGHSVMPIMNLDLFPTILEAAGIDPEPYKVDGISILSVLKGLEELPDRPLFWHFPVYLEAYDIHNNETRDSLFRTRPGSAVRYGDWKLHYYFEDQGIELYNLREDISERNNLALDNPEKKEELLELLKEWWEETDAPIPRELNPDFVSY